MPDGEQIGCLGVQHIESTRSIQPSINLSAAGFSLGLSNLGCTDHTTKDRHQHIELIGRCGLPGTRSHWEFRNDLHLRYPRQVFLLVEFSSNHDNDEPFPFILRFNSDCQVKLSRPWIRGGDKFVGQPAQKLDITIKGNWRRSEVLKHKRSSNTGIVVPLERLKNEVSCSCNDFKKTCWTPSRRTPFSLKSNLDNYQAPHGILSYPETYARYYGMFLKLVANWLHTLAL
jgi:hypothetical protein